MWFDGCGVIARLCLAILVATLGVPAWAQPHAPDTLFGIRIGQALESQFEQCPKNDKGEYDFGYHKGDTPCWKAGGEYYRDVKLPAKVLRDTGAFVQAEARITLREGVVVEIVGEAHHDTWRQAERYMLRHYGKPAETETYERASRVFGVSRHRTHKWQGNGVALIFIERANSDNARMRLYNEVWAVEDAKWREELRNRP